MSNKAHVKIYTHYPVKDNIYIFGGRNNYKNTDISKALAYLLQTITNQSPFRKLLCKMIIQHFQDYIFVAFYENSGEYLENSVSGKKVVHTMRNAIWKL